MAVAAHQLAFLDPSPENPDEDSLEWVVLDGLQSHVLSGSRQALAHWAQCSDREVRRAIARLIEMGWPVVSDSRHAGYRLASEPEELKAAIADAASREVAMRDRRCALERAQRLLSARVGG